MASKARSHDENRKLICCICYSESGLKAERNVSKNQEILIKEKVSMNFSLLDHCFPVGLCSKCHRKLGRVKSGEPASILTVSEHFGSFVPHELRNQRCQCIICIRARLNGPEWKLFSDKCNARNKKETDKKLCPNCLCKVSPDLTFFVHYA